MGLGLNFLKFCTMISVKPDPEPILVQYEQLLVQNLT